MNYIERIILTSIIELARNDVFLTACHIKEKFGLNKATAFRYLEKLVEQGKLREIKIGRNRVFIPIKLSEQIESFKGE